MATKQVPIKSGVELPFDPDLVTDDETFSAIFMLGLSVVLSKGMSKLTKNAFNDAEAIKAGYENAEAHMKAEILKKAEANAKDLLENGIKAKKKKSAVSGKVQTEAMRIARGIIKDAIKADGLVISHYKASDITAAAKDFLAGEMGAEVIKQAEENLRQREATPTGGLKIADLLKADPKLVAKAEAEKAERKKNAPLSAKQAGKAAPRKKGAAAQASA